MLVSRVGGRVGWWRAVRMSVLLPRRLCARWSIWSCCVERRVGRCCCAGVRRLRACAALVVERVSVPRWAVCVLVLRRRLCRLGRVSVLLHAWARAGTLLGAACASVPVG